jgi:hypothetical protein
MARLLLVLVLRALRGGLIAASVMLVPLLVWPNSDARLTGYAGLLIVLLSVQAGLRAVAALGDLETLARRLACGFLLALIESLIVGVGLYVLYAWLSPGVLEARFTKTLALVAAGSPVHAAERVALLTAGHAQATDPLFKAVEGGMTIFFAALLLVGYLGIRAQVASRLSRGRTR